MTILRGVLAVAFAVGILVLPLDSEAQQATKIWRLPIEQPTKSELVII
jgi:hypothetical protein